MNPIQSFIVRTRDDQFHVLMYGGSDGRRPFAEFCGSCHGTERITRIGVPQNLVFPGDDAAVAWLLKACLADIDGVAGPVRSVRPGKCAALAA